MSTRLGPALRSYRLDFGVMAEQAAWFQTFNVKRLVVGGLVERAVFYGFDDDGRRTVTFMSRARTEAGFGWNCTDHLVGAA